MQKVFFVKNGELDEVNTILAEGGTIVDIRPVAESVVDSRSKGTGDVYAYVVVNDSKVTKQMYSYTSLISKTGE